MSRRDTRQKPTKKPAKPTAKRRAVAHVNAAAEAEIQRDNLLRIEALQAKSRGDHPSRFQLAGWKRADARDEEAKRWEYYATIPQKHWLEMCGRQRKVLVVQAEQYRIPFAGAVVDLRDVARAFSDFLAANARKLNAADSDDELLGGGNSPALERYRDERAKLAKLDRLERERTLLPRDEVHQKMMRFAAIIRSCGDALQRQFGPEAHALLDESINEATREIDGLKDA